MFGGNRRDGDGGIDAERGGRCLSCYWGEWVVCGRGHGEGEGGVVEVIEMGL